jgi:hypothetical protein
MVNSKIRKLKKVRVKDTVSPPACRDKNILRSNFVFDKTKFRRRKWKFLRSWKNYTDSRTFKRYAPNLNYVPLYSRLINYKIDIDNIKINKFMQFFSYKSRLLLVKRLRGLLRYEKISILKKRFVFKHITTNFNNFDTNFEMLLLRIGIVNNMKLARTIIKQGALLINGRNCFSTRHLINYDLVSFSKKNLKILDKETNFDHRRRKYKNFTAHLRLKLIDYLELMCIEAKLYTNSRLFLGVLPFTSPVNYCTMAFIYFNHLLKNQWNYFFDFYVAKKFVQYAR